MNKKLDDYILNIDNIINNIVWSRCHLSIGKVTANSSCESVRTSVERAVWLPTIESVWGPVRVYIEDFVDGKQ